MKRQPITALGTFEQNGVFDSHDLSQRYDQLEAQNQSLLERSEQLEAEIAQLRGAAVTIEDKAQLESKIQELTAQLSQQGGEHHIPLREICRNPFQPRTIFPEQELQAFSHCLKEDGQNTPVILIPLDEETKEVLWSGFKSSLFVEFLTEEEQQQQWNEVRFMLFDGERRWRSASLIHWETIRSVFKPASSSSQLDLIELQADALKTTLHRQDLHPLNLAEVLVSQVLHHYKDFPANPGESKEKAVVRVLGAVTLRLERAKMAPQVSKIVDALQPEQKAWLDMLSLKPEEFAVMELILRYHLNPFSVDKNVFSMLSLPPDLKEAVQKNGIDRSRILEVAKLKAERLGISEAEAVEARAEVLRGILSGELDRSSKIKSRVAEKITELNPESVQQKPVLPMEVQTVQKIKLKKLKPAELEELRAAMYAKLEEIDALIKQAL